MLVPSLAAAALASVNAGPAKLLRFPDIHGDTVAFVHASDIWLVNRDGGVARRLTTHAGNESSPRFSPDGKWIAFSGQYDSAVPQVYVVSIDGGEPKRVTFEAEGTSPVGWSPNGRIAYITAAGQAFTPRLHLVDPKGGMPEPTDLGEFTNGSFSPDGTQIAFNRNNSYAFNWRFYRGGTQGRIAFWDFAKKTYWEAPSGKENSYWPMWIGDKVFYITDKNRDLNLWSYDTGSKRQTQVTQFNDGDIKNPQSDDRRIVFERNGELVVFDTQTGQSETPQVFIASDINPARPRYRRFGDAIGQAGISPSGKRVAVEARGEIYSLPAQNGETRNLTNTSGAREQNPQWAPDGQTVAFLSDRTGEWRIYTVPQMGGAATEVPTPKEHRIIGFGWGPGGKSIGYVTVDSTLYLYDVEKKTATKVFSNPGSGINADWSADGNWIAYTQVQPNLFSAVYLYDVKAGKSHKVTEGYYDDGAVAFDLNGKYLYFVSSRTYGVNFGAWEIGLHQENVQRVYAMILSKDQTDPLLPGPDEEPVKAGEAPAAPGGEKPADAPSMKVDLEGLDQRVVPLPWPPSSYGLLVGLDNGVMTQVGPQLVKFDMGSRTPQPITAGIGGLSFNPKRTKMAYLFAGGVGIADVRPGVDPAAGRVPTSDVARTWNPRDEWEQMFWEAWRHQRDNFYDAKMVGVDWDAVGKKYAALLPYVSHRNDLNYLLGLMIGELGTGHAYVQGAGDTGFQPTNVSVGQLGADLGVRGGKVYFKKIYRGLNFEPARRGPLGAPGVNVSEGDYLLEINGQAVTTDRSVGELLVDKAEKAVTLTVNGQPSTDGARKVTIRPVADDSDLRYISWVEFNRAYVREKSGGRIGYMHVPNTSFNGIIEFMKGFYSNSDAEAWVIDERYNGGGFIPTFFVEYLARQMQTVFKPRYGVNVPMPQQSLQGPKVMLINEFAGSGGDMLPWLFKRNGLGPLIGTRTWGGLVGIQGAVGLVDGGGVTAPAFGIFDRDKGEWIAENIGVEPDIEVDARPDLVAQGKDPVLDKGLEVLMKQLPKEPKRWPEPGFPKIGKAGN